MLGICACALPAGVRADNMLTPDYGMGVMVGGGVIGFVDDEARDAAGAGGTWEARLAYQPRETFSVEAAYLGSLQDLDALGTDGNSRLLATAVEANLRVSFFSGNVRPYALLGAGWARYSLLDTPSTAALVDQDDLLIVPLGAGVAYWLGDVVLDARGTYRATAGADLFSPQGEDITLDSWNVTLRVGFEL